MNTEKNPSWHQDRSNLSPLQTEIDVEASSWRGEQPVSTTSQVPVGLGTQRNSVSLADPVLPKTFKAFARSPTVAEGFRGCGCASCNVLARRVI